MKLTHEAGATRLGILTLTQSENYGTVLQAFATKKILADALPAGTSVTVAPTDVGRVRRRRIYSLVNPRNPSSGLTRIDNFVQMRRFAYANVVDMRGYVNIEDRARTTTYLAEHFDALITGSDEVWNLAFVGGRSIYFVPPEFDGYRASFATSANRIDLEALSERTRDQLAESLSRYDFISVRDTNTKNVVESLVPRSDVVEIIDPTLIIPELLPAAELKTEPPRRPRILLMLRNRSLATRVIETFQNSAEIDTAFIRYPGAQFLALTPRQFASVFGSYDCVVTDFFHGTCMAIRGGAFFVSVDSEPVYATYESKIANLLRKLGLGTHYVNAASEGAERGFQQVHELVNARIHDHAQMPDYATRLEAERTRGLEVAGRLADQIRARIPVG